MYDGSALVKIMGREFRGAGVYPPPGAHSRPLPAIKAVAAKKAAAGGMIEDVGLFF